MAASVRVSITHVFAGLAVSDFAAARAWYERLFGRPPDRQPMPEDAVWHLSGTGLVYVVGDAARAGHALLTLAVADLDGYLTELAGRGLMAESGEGRARLRDPDGNMITLFQDPQA
jgi:catechol 2,3-dioxygenase-like lactoylglutathione lyase family enzyme